jgi:hypothetical protein
MCFILKNQFTFVFISIFSIMILTGLIAQVYAQHTAQQYRGKAVIDSWSHFGIESQVPETLALGIVITNFPLCPSLNIPVGIP